jgi:ubiquinone/menaquinone biosynthesis C-methylase UbiE
MATPEAMVRLQLDILADGQVELSSNSKVLDVGCGAGNLVNAWLRAGYDAYGCDLKFKDGPYVDTLIKEERIRLLDRQSYKLPFADQSFDALMTTQVMEHVQDYETTLSEMRRVLKPNGVSLHMFPARWRPIEPHVYVPFATVLQSQSWLSLWAFLGIRSSSQAKLKWRDVARSNYEYLASSTNYLRGREILSCFRRYFPDVQFAERSFLRNSPNSRGRMLYSVGRYLPFIFSLYRNAWSRTVLTR